MESDDKIKETANQFYTARQQGKRRKKRLNFVTDGLCADRQDNKTNRF
jgi:hypothetical protein